MTLFILFAFLYLVVAIKVDEWTTIYLLDWKSEVPEGFLLYQDLYRIAPILLFLASVFVLVYYRPFNLVFGFIVLVACWSISGRIGHKKAFKTFREIQKEFLEENRGRDFEKTEQGRFALAELKKTDAELLDRVMARAKSGF